MLTSAAAWLTLQYSSNKAAAASLMWHQNTWRCHAAEETGDDTKHAHTVGFPVRLIYKLKAGLWSAITMSNHLAAHELLNLNVVPTTCAACLELGAVFSDCREMMGAREDGWICC